jgi:hypothetical protein
VHSVRLERLGEGLAVRSSETVAAHWVDEPVVEAFAYGMEDVVHASMGETYSGF